MEIAAWAQKHFQKSLSVKTAYCGIHKEIKLCDAKKKAHVSMIRKHCRLLWGKAHLKWTEPQWQTDLWSDESKFEITFGNHGRCVLWIKEETDPLACYQHSVQELVSQMGVHISTYGIGNFDEWKDIINAEKHMQVLEQHVLLSRQDYCQGRPCIFQRNNAKPHTASITAAWLPCAGVAGAQSRLFPCWKHLEHHETQNM